MKPLNQAPLPVGDTQLSCMILLYKYLYIIRRYIHIHNHTLLRVYIHKRYRLIFFIFFPLSLTQKSRGLGARTKKEISKRAGDWAGVIRKGNYC